MTTDVDVLVDFLNTLDEHAGEEELGDDASAAAWFGERGLPAEGLVAEEARSIRAALRAAADGRAVPPGHLAGVGLHVTVGEGGDLLLASDHPLGPLVATAVRLSYEGRWDRLKLCGLDTCRYAFYDESRNRSGRWCSMATCGNRAKTRAFRERHRAGHG